ncbi:MAG: DUF6311 domain-containing protein [bacterium]|nr:DUF6311 domain-containing protein [bacterium]
MFGLIFGFDFALASAKFWTNPKNDMIAMTAGFEALLRDPWAFPPTLTSHLNGQPVSIVFTDSIPWLALVLKALGLGHVFNPLGLFLLLSYILQPVAMQTLLRALGVRDFWALLAGCLLALMFPAWTVRQFGHIALCGHWLLMFGLALSIASARFGLSLQRAVAFAGLAALAIGIHAYHLPPIGAAFGAALLSELFQRGRAGLLPVAKAVGLMIAALVFSAWLLGYSQGHGESGGADAIGFYSMNVLGPIFPQGSQFFGQTWNGSWFRYLFDANGGQWFEGYQYLGAGVLLMILLASVLALRQQWIERPDLRPWLRRFGPLTVAMIVLTCWAIGPNVYVGALQIAKLPKPHGGLMDLLGMFRCHGRFFWIVGYLLIALAITAISRLPKRAAYAALVIGLAAQAIDTIPLREGVHSLFMTPERFLYPRALATSPAIRDRQWIFTPTYFCMNNTGDMQALVQLARLAISTGGTPSSFPTARNTEGACAAPTASLRVTAKPEDRRIVVALSHETYEGGALEPFAARSDCYRFSRGILCGYGLDGVPGLNPVPGALLLSSSVREVLTIRADQGVLPKELVSGWSGPEEKGIWSVGKSSVVEVTAPADLKPGDNLTLEFISIGFSDMPIRPQSVTVKINGQKVALLEVAAGAWAP